MLPYRLMIEELYKASIAAGICAKALQKDILNEGKETKREENEDDDHYEMRRAKTKVDVMVQDMLLASMMDYQNELCLDVEEESEYVDKFPLTQGQTTLVIDPIDGTLEYINQKDTYSICVALLAHHQVQAALVYFPNRDEAYVYESSLQARYIQQAHAKKLTEGEPIVYKQCAPPTIVYQNDRVHHELIKALHKDHYTIQDDRIQTCPQALIECLRQQAVCYVCDTRNIRDILIGAILSKTKEGAALDEHGEHLEWPQKGRVPFVVFTMYPETIKNYLK